MMEVEEMASSKEMIGLLEALRIINETLNDQAKLDKAIVRIQNAIEKGAAAKPTKPDNA